MPDKYSYEKILCFEGCFKQAVRSPAVVSAAFKALIAMSKNKDIRVMMPLLTSKDKVIVRSPVSYFCIILWLMVRSYLQASVVELNVFFARFYSWMNYDVR